MHGNIVQKIPKMFVFVDLFIFSVFFIFPTYIPQEIKFILIFCSFGTFQPTATIVLAQ